MRIAILIVPANDLHLLLFLARQRPKDGFRDVANRAGRGFRDGLEEAADGRQTGAEDFADGVAYCGEEAWWGR